MFIRSVITEINGREVLDSRGNPTVEAEVILNDGSIGTAIVPSGASTGAYEAHELRDCDLSRYLGKGVEKAVGHINREIARALIGMNPFQQKEVDRRLICLDGTADKSKLGANAILAVSLATAKAAAAFCRQPLYRYIGGVNAEILPIPMMNILNGGKHADSGMSIQEFMIVPAGGTAFRAALEKSVTVYHTLKKLLKAEGLSTAVGDEGGFAPNLKTDEQALDFLVRAISEAGFLPGQDFTIALDAAATEMYDEAVQAKGNHVDGKTNESQYLFWKSGILRTTGEMIDYWAGLCKCYPISSIEDGLAEEDWNGWKQLNERLGDSVQLVGDDLYVTNPSRIRTGILERASNAVLIKPNQIGTLSETMEAVRMTQRNGWHAVLSHRSGESEDTTIADLSVALNTGQIKTGAPCRAERTAKYNRILKIEDELSFDYGKEREI